MRSILFIFIFSALLPSQSDEIKSGVYKVGEGIPDHDVNILKGNTTYFQSFNIILHPVKAGAPSASITGSDEETLIIVKEGDLAITQSKETKSLGPGSVILVLPGESVVYENKSKTDAAFYRLTFRSKDQAVGSRGNSFSINWNDVEKKKTDKGGYRQFFNRPTAMTTKFEMHVTTLNEGLSSHAPHTHPEEEIVLMLRGDARMNIEGAFYDASSGDVIFLASGISHAIQNVGKADCEYFAFQWK